MGKHGPLIVRSRLVPEKFCVNLFGTLWARKSFPIDRRVINHERIHTAQQKELLFIPFYILYLLEWVWRLLQYRNWMKAYRNISFEREAYARGDDLNYLQRRHHYAWLTGRY